VLDTNPEPPPSPGQKADGENGTGTATGDTGTARGIKGYGTILAVTADSITIQVESSAPDQPAQIQAAITGDTTFVDHGATLPSRPALAAGDHVAFGALRTAAGYDLGVLETNPEPPPPAGQTAESGAARGSRAAAGTCVATGS
jgi:hypothetical protein